MAYSTATSTTARDAERVATDMKNKAVDQFEQVASTVEGVAKQAAERGQKAAENAQVVAQNFGKAIDSSVKEQPMATLVGAVVVGFVLGALWKS